MQKYISQLNEAQQEPVLQKDGPMIIIAGAGSGKTRVLTVRIAYLMSLGVDSFSILALTFTNKAAREMKSRIAQIVGTGEAKPNGQKEIPFGTCGFQYFVSIDIHSVENNTQFIH